MKKDLKSLLNSTLTYTDLMSDEDKFKFTEDTIFDRIINLKFTTAPFNSVDDSGNPTKIADEFILRSDYEIVYPRETVSAIVNSNITNNRYYIRRCGIKPSIRVQYNQASSGTAIGIDIFISNFFILTKDGRSLMSLNQRTYDIASIDIQMGYIGQFNALLGLDTSSLIGKTVNNLTPEDLYDFSREGYGVQTLRISNVEYVKTEKVAPDYELHIHGYVGSTIHYSPEVNVENTKYETLPETAYFTSTEAMSQYESLFYKYVTRRFLNQNAFSGIVPEPGDDGFFTDADALKYGIKVICSNGVKALKPIEEVKDADGNVVVNSSETILSLGGVRNTAVSALQRIAEYTRNTICYTRLNTGDFIAYTKEEVKAGNIKDLFASLQTYLNDNQAGTYFRNILPAVYNINIDAVATIVCPFFTWVNPFQQLQFASRYVTSSLTSFYAGFTPDIISFYAINVVVTFSTVEDANEMQIKAVPDINS